MSIAYPVQQSLANVVNFEPTGGPNGDPCFKLDAQGSVPAMLAIRVPPIQEADWDVAIESKIDTTNLAVSSNGFEGFGIRTRLLRSGVSEPIILYDNGLLTRQNNDWYTVRTGWHLRHQTIPLPNVSPDVIDVTMCVKGPVGASAKISQLTVVNKYSKTYNINIPGVSPRVQTFRKTDITRNWIGTERTILSNTGQPVTLNAASYFTVDDYAEAYLDTIPCNIQKNERVKCSLTAIMGFLFDDTAHLPFTHELSIKFRSPEGNELWQNVITHSSPVPLSATAPRQNTVEFIADQNYTQANLILTIRSADGVYIPTQTNRAGIFLEIESSRPILA